MTVWLHLLLKKIFFEKDSCLLALATSTNHMQSCFKIDLGLIKLSDVIFLVAIMKWRMSGQGYKHLTRFQYSYCSILQLVPCKRLTLSAASIFVTEGLFIYIYFQLFEENPQKSDFLSWRKNFSNDFALFR